MKLIKTIFLFFIVVAANAQCLFELDTTIGYTCILDIKTDEFGRKWLLKNQYANYIWWNFYNVDEMIIENDFKSKVYNKKKHDLTENELELLSKYDNSIFEHAITRDSIMSVEIINKYKMFNTPLLSAKSDEFSFKIDKLKKSKRNAWAGCLNKGPKCKFTHFTLTAKYKDRILYHGAQTHQGLFTKKELLYILNQNLVLS